MKRLVFLFLLISGCATTNKGVLLHWPANPASSIEYGTYMDKFPEEYDFNVNAIDVINNTNEIGIIVQSLKAVKLPEHMPLVTTVRTKNEGILEVKTISAEPIFEDEPIDKEEEMDRKIQKEMAGTLQLLADLNTTGEIQSFFLVQRQKNLISLFFKLPNKAIEVGELWNIPVNLIELGNGYRVEKSQRYNKARVLSIKNDPEKGRIAEILYVVSEELEGNYRLREDASIEAPVKFLIAASYVGYAELFVDKGYWKSYTAKLTFSGSGGLSINSSNLHALRPINQN